MHSRSRSTAIFDGLTDTQQQNTNEISLRPRTPTGRHSRHASLRVPGSQESEPFLRQAPSVDGEDSVRLKRPAVEQKALSTRTLAVLWPLSLLLTCLVSVLASRAVFERKAADLDRGYPTELSKPFPTHILVETDIRPKNQPVRRFGPHPITSVAARTSRTATSSSPTATQVSRTSAQPPMSTKHGMPSHVTATSSSPTRKPSRLTARTRASTGMSTMAAISPAWT